MTNELLKNNKKIPTKGTFVEYKPHHVHQVKTCILKRMLCDDCTKFIWWYDSLMRFLLKGHKCEKPNCVKYHIEMGNVCTCIQCIKCFFLTLLDMLKIQ